MFKQKKKWWVIIPLLCVFLSGVYVTMLWQKKPEAEGTQLMMSPAEKERFEALTQVKIITQEDIRGVFSEQAFKLTGFEENGMQSVQELRDDYYQKLITSQDSFLVERGKQWLNAWNKRELYVRFVVDYGLGFDLEPIVSQIQVDEYTGEVIIPTPELVITHFYIDPTFQLEEKNGVLVKLLNREFTTEEKDFILKKMEEQVKTRIIHNEEVHKRATEATKERITDLLQAVNPKVKVVFR